MAMTREEKIELARKMLQRNGYSEEEIEQIIRRAWGDDNDDR